MRSTANVPLCPPPPAPLGSHRYTGESLDPATDICLNHDLASETALPEQFELLLVLFCHLDQVTQGVGDLLVVGVGTSNEAL